MANQVYVCGTLFHLFISIIKSILLHKKGYKSLLVINDHTPNIEKIIARIEREGFFDHIISVPFFEITNKLKKEESFVKRTILRNKLSVSYVEKHSEIRKYIPFINNAEINLFYNLGLVSSYFIINFPTNYIRLVEDGYRNYNPKINNLTAFKRKYILRSAIGEGRDDSIRAIEVQHPHKLPKQVRHKGTILDLKKLKKELSEIEKARLISIFLDNNKINIEEGKSLILLTQPLSEDRFINEDQKIAIYISALKNYIGHYTIYLKSHPRELTNYKTAFSFDFVEIPKTFPLELLDFFDNINFNIGLTLFSSAINNLNCIEKKVTLGADYVKNFKA